MMAGRGDRHAFTELVRLNQGVVRGLCRRLCGASGDADDVAQAAFVIAWRRIETFGGGSFRSWVCTIAFREFLRTKRRSTSRVAAEACSVINPSPTDRSSETTGERLDLTAALTQLPEPERVAVALCLGAGLTHEEAAAALDLPLGTVKSHVLRGRARLQGLLGDYVA
ncbi:sigma-70 family RNA polymerase sigma factor [bacterium]|nr:sigma-70 family RNA polymerase sigma factor [bacterium]